jgi:hypothetical protein
MAKKQPAQQAQPEAPAQEQAFTEAPRYRLTEKAYFPSVKMQMYDDNGELAFEEMFEAFLNPEDQPVDQRTKRQDPLIIEYDGEPGPHMVPLNDAAKAMVKKFPPREMHKAINDLHVVGRKE